jgi:hypothetical protein
MGLEGGIYLMEKTRGRNSRVRVPLKIKLDCSEKIIIGFKLSGQFLLGISNIFFELNCNICTLMSTLGPAISPYYQTIVSTQHYKEC